MSRSYTKAAGISIGRIAAQPPALGEMIDDLRAQRATSGDLPGLAGGSPPPEALERKMASSAV